MTPAIPIENLFYLLVYAWDHRLPPAAVARIDAASCPDLNNLFGRVMVEIVRSLVRRGMDRVYLPVEDESARIRGRIDFAASAKRQTWNHGRLCCIYDELSADVIQNQILKATVVLLRRDRSVDSELRTRLGEVSGYFDGVSDLRVKPAHFHRIQLQRNNRTYRFAMHLCRLVHASLLPGRSHQGQLSFRDYTQDGGIMPAVFERFVRRFADRHLHDAKVSAMQVRWEAVADDPATQALIPGMTTDVTVEWPDRKLILDCKYYREALSSHYGAQGFRSENLYQLHAYLTNKSGEDGWEHVEGALLYPSNGCDLDHSFVLHGRHRVRIATINLNQPWQRVHRELMRVFENDTIRISKRF